MLLPFYLLFLGLHVTEAGCILENKGITLSIKAHKGRSVLLPCYCADLQTKPERLTWNKFNTNTITWEAITSESGQYRNRVQLFNNHSPGNLSLLISHLTEEDTGDYWCEAETSGTRDIRLTVKGSSLNNSGGTLQITAHTGGSVLLPCYCTDLQTTPDTFTWKKYNTTRDTWNVISSVSGQYRNRVQLFNDHSPANLSLLISHLAEEDGGDYRCHLTRNEYTDVKLSVEDSLITSTSTSTAATSSIQTPTSSPQSLPFVPFALVTVIFLHIIVAVVYHTKRTKAQSDSAGVHYSTADEVVSLE